LIQGRFEKRGNFELVAPLRDGGLARYWRDNDEPNLTWHGPSIFAQDVGVFDSVTMIQSDFASPGGAGNLEVVVRWGESATHARKQLFEMDHSVYGVRNHRSGPNRGLFCGITPRKI
jgi:hypothetical protein